MPRSLVYSALFATSLAYRELEFTGERCTGAQVGIHRIAEPSTCTAFDEGVFTSVLVNIDNLNDYTYTVNVYDTGDCTGDIVGSIIGRNGCLNTSQNTAGRHKTPNKGFVTNHQHNLASKDEEDD